MATTTIKIIQTANRGLVLGDPAKRQEIIPELAVALDIPETLLELYLSVYTKELSRTQIPEQGDMLLWRLLASGRVRAVVPRNCAPSDLARLTVRVPALIAKYNANSYIPAGMDFCVEKVLDLKDTQVPVNRYADAVWLSAEEQTMVVHAESTKPVKQAAPPSEDGPQMRATPLPVNQYLDITAAIDGPGRARHGKSYDLELERYLAAILNPCDHRRAVALYRRLGKTELLNEYLEGTAGLIPCRKCHQPVVCEHELLVWGLEAADAIAATEAFADDPRKTGKPAWQVSCRICGRLIGLDYGKMFSADNTEDVGFSDRSKFFFTGVQSATELLEFDARLISSGDFSAQATRVVYDCFGELGDRVTDLAEFKDDGTRFFAFVATLAFAVSLVLAGNRAVRLRDFRPAKSDLQSQIDLWTGKAVYSRWRNLISRFDQTLPAIFRDVSAYVRTRNSPLMVNQAEEKNVELICSIISDPLARFAAFCYRLRNKAVNDPFALVDVDKLLTGSVVVKRLIPFTPPTDKMTPYERLYNQLMFINKLGSQGALVRRDNRRLASFLAARQRPYITEAYSPPLTRLPFDFRRVYAKRGDRVELIAWDEVLFKDGSHVPFSKVVLGHPPVVDVYSSLLECPREEFLKSLKTRESVHPPLKPHKKVAQEVAATNAPRVETTALSYDAQLVRKLVEYGNINLVSALGATERLPYLEVAKGVLDEAPFSSIHDTRILKVAGYLVELRVLLGRLLAYNPAVDKSGVVHDIMLRVEKELPATALSTPARLPPIAARPHLAAHDLYRWYVQQIAATIDAVAVDKFSKIVAKEAFARVLRTDELYTRFAIEKVRTNNDDDAVHTIDTIEEEAPFADLGQLARFKREFWTDQ